jgi:hypothetical protein
VTRPEPRQEPAPARTRWLEWFADPPGTAFADSLIAFRTLLLVHGAVRVWDAARVGGHPLHVAIAVVLTAAAAASLRRGLARPAVFAGVWAVLVEVAITHGPANHVYLELLLLAAYALLDPERGDEAVLLACVLRWMVALLLFWAGLQKLLYGTYFRAEFLCWMIAQRPAFADALGFLLPADELARLAAAGAQAVGSGPYRTHAWLLIAASNAVWIAELALPALLLFRRTRVWGAWLAAAFVLSIQLVAREAVFGLLYSQLVLLVLPGRGYRRIAPLYAAAYAYLVLHLLGLAPADWILKRGAL